MNLSIEQYIYGLLVTTALIIWAGNVARRLRSERQKFADIEPLVQLHATADHVSAGWFAVGIPTIWQSKYKYASRFKPCVIVLKNSILHVYESKDNEIFTLAVSGQPISYEQPTGNFKVTADGENYVLSFSRSNIYPSGIFVGRVPQWVRWLKECGATVERRSFLSK